MKQVGQQGFSLLEVLVAVVVLSVGLLGIAGLQLTGLRYSHNANLRYIAVLQANDMADRLRANPAGVASGSYNAVSGPGSDPGCIATSCSPAQLANNDIFEWNRDYANLLPSGAGTVTGGGTGSVFTITVSWNERGGEGVGIDAHNYTLMTTP